jgi:hypothetical protein
VTGGDVEVDRFLHLRLGQNEKSAFLPAISISLPTPIETS